MKIGLIGNGGREHALAIALTREGQRDALYVYGTHLNPGIEKLTVSSCLGDLRDIEKIVDFFVTSNVELVVVGPEVPLILGVSDKLRSKGLKVVGPTKAQARLEGDKIFMRDLLFRRIKSGSPRWRKVDEVASALEFISEVGPVAVKPVGLTGGKGVRVMGVHLSSIEEVQQEVKLLLERDGTVLLEERLIGEEFSRMAFVSNHEVVPMPVAQDFKYAYDGDKGGMTGGMGAYTMPNGSMPFLNEEDLKQADSILQLTMDALAEATGEEYRGILYGQFMATANGVRVIEFNVRLGDPEGINTMCLIQNDVVNLFNKIACGKMSPHDVSFMPKASICKYLVPTPYPDVSNEYVEIDLSENEIERAGFSVIFASVVRQGRGLRTLGSRALAIVGVGDDVFSISDQMEELLMRIEPPTLRHRKDIGDREVIRNKIEKMRNIRNSIIV